MQSFYTGRALFILAALLTTLPLGAHGQTLSIQAIVGRMQQVQEQGRSNFSPYSVTRQYQLSTDDKKQSGSQVVAEINAVGPATMDYTLHTTAGSNRGESIVRKVLEHESAMKSRPEVSEISARNYNFASVGRDTVDGHDCYVLQLQPKRDVSELLRGKAWVDAKDFVVRKVEGEPAKSPSWWIKNLQVSIHYGEVQGVWTQSATRAVADVRFAGTHVLTSRAVGLTPASELAKNHPNRPAVRRTNPRRAMADTATWVAR